MAALGKALGSQGAFCVADKKIIDKLINHAPTFIFSTALAPIQVLWTEFLLTQNFTHILEQQKKLKKLLSEFSLSSHIVPAVIGENEDAVNMANHLRKKGFLSCLSALPPSLCTLPAYAFPFAPICRRKNWLVFFQKWKHTNAL